MQVRRSTEGTSMTRAVRRDPIYRHRRFSPEIIETCVRWYVTYRLSYRDLVAMMAERGVVVSHTTIRRWVLRYSDGGLMSVKWKTMKAVFRYSESTSGPILKERRVGFDRKALGLCMGARAGRGAPRCACEERRSVPQRQARRGLRRLLNRRWRVTLNSESDEVSRRWTESDEQSSPNRVPGSALVTR
jgi:hypothetical protein